MILSPRSNLRGELTVPGDKSISHRSIMLGALSEGLTEIKGFLDSADCRSTMGAFRSMGITIEENSERILVHGKGLYGLNEPLGIIDTGNSGTTTRLMAGILSGQKFSSEMSGDASLNTRPMKRVIDPLTQMGANIKSASGNGCAPLIINPSSLKGIDYVSPVASAQVKSCVLLAGMYAEGKTSVTEPVLSRNHTELMINGFGGEIISNGNTATITPSPKLVGQKVLVPGDISSAAFFIVAGLITPDSEILIKNVGINPTRDGVLQVALKMGGNIQKLNERTASGEPVCDLLVKYTPDLKATTIEGDIIPALIDEIPVIAIMATQAKGVTTIKDAAELKVKESNRIDTVVTNLKAMGADITPTDDGMIINGATALRGANINSYDDHRIAMAFTVASLVASGDTDIIHGECVNISYPTFYDTLASLK